MQRLPVTLMKCLGSPGPGTGGLGHTGGHPNWPRCATPGAGDPPRSDGRPEPQVWIYAVVVTDVVAGALLGWIPRWPGLAHEVALPPLDLIADVRVLTARASTTWVFVLGVIAMLAIRASILAAVLGFTSRRLRFAVRFYLAALAPALLASGLDFSGRAILYAYLIWGGLLVTVATFIVLGCLPWIGPDTLHASFGVAQRERFRIGALCSFLVVLALLGSAWRHPGEAVQVLIVPVSAALTAAMARWLSAPPKRRRVSRGFAITATVGVVILLAAAVAVARSGQGSQSATPAHRNGSLMLVAGVDTSTGKPAA